MLELSGRLAQDDLVKRVEAWTRHGSAVYVRGSVPFWMLDFPLLGYLRLARGVYNIVHVLW